jgi:circadian clock protein KaiC
MTQQSTQAPKEEIDRLPSLVPGLDTILRGGFLQGGLYMIQGAPGMGKTILANQIIYNNATANDHAMFVTVLGENHGRMMAHLRPMGFFNEAAVPDNITYISGYQELESEGLKGLSTLIRKEVLAHKVKMLVLDDVSAVEAKTSERYEMKRFTHEMQTLASATNCTMFFLTTVSGSIAGVENTMVDGLIELRGRFYDSRHERRLIVHKLRGSSFLEGEHAFRITSAGVSVFPRTESLRNFHARSSGASGVQRSFGLASLDAMFGGGLPGGSVTMLLGGSGTGKTTLGLHFLSQSSADEPGIFFGCYEPPEQLRWKASTIGIDLAAAEERGDLEILWNPIGEYVLDELASQLLESVRRQGTKRLVIDGIALFQEAAAEPERITRFWSALTNELKALGVTTLYTLELQEIAGPDLRLPLSGVASLSEVAILMRYVELQSRLYRLISLLKIRGGAFDPTIREFTMSNTGIEVGDRFKGVDTVLSGVGRFLGDASGGQVEDSEQTGSSGTSRRPG